MPLIQDPGCPPPLLSPLALDVAAFGVFSLLGGGDLVGALGGICAPNQAGVVLPAQSVAISGADVHDALYTTPEVAASHSVGDGLLYSRVLLPGQTQVAAMLVTFIGLMTPSMLFSGLMTPVSSMDPSAQIISRFIPASYFIRMVRGVFLKGLGFEHFAYDLLTLGTFAARGSLNIVLVFVLLGAAAVLGDSANYMIGKYFGALILKREGAWFLKKKHIERTHKFYEKYGPKTIVLARFVPIIRTFAPFLAGVAGMTYRRFLSFNVVG